ncbi:MAG: UDP-N-acetylmuramoyl-L-alanyl-D-glutamate--2,6-diaminopimelate ligase [Burkholderiaceae bacterium]
MALRDPQAEALAGWLRQHLRPGAHLRADSRKIAPGDAFLAYPGERADGRAHVSAAIERGAAAVLVEAQGQSQGLAQGPAPDVPLREVSGLKSLCGPLASCFHGHPSDALEVVGVTGTNGKTSCTHWISQGLQQLEMPCAVVGTLGAGLSGSSLQDFGLTTPDALELQALFARLRDEGEVRAVAIEASSIGLVQYRLAGTRIAVAVFTNLTRDHLDVHCTMQSYAAAKARLFAWPGLRSAVINLDDAWSGTMLQALHPSVECIGTTQKSAMQSGLPMRQLAAERIEQTASGMTVWLGGDFGRARFETRLIGRHNVANLLSVCASWLALGYELEACIPVIEALKPVQGRMQPVSVTGAAALPLVLIDYAHTPDALEHALKALEPLAQARGGRVWCVFGAGGDRDPGKRPEMARIAQALADHVVITSDNPRGESPERILDDIASGLSHMPALREADRGAAIDWAVAQAQPSDLILVAGKGHEAYQEIAGQRIPFSDEARARLALLRRLEVGVGPEDRAAGIPGEVAGA